MRLIDADELIVIEYGGIKFVPKEFIDDAPTIDAVLARHGEWLHPEEGDEDYHTVSCSCSVCGWKFNLYEDDIDGAPYCAVCGAKMEPVSPLYQTDEEEP